MLSACSDDAPQVVTTAKSPESPFVFPNSPAFKAMQSRAVDASFETDWENWQYIPLPNGMQIYTPWGKYTVGNDPAGIFTDIKKADGSRLFHLKSTSDIDPATD
ncbi:MAG: hypothetical protein NC043_06380 [Muribaculaceae bacterium]|nr:hypothetical protein [Muribaculaceae bacterium]